MADKKRNQILEEQRRAREEYLKLKKMQKGELYAGPKPSEVAIVPKTFGEKCANFWFQYKWHMIALVTSAILMVIFVAQCMSRPDYDITVVYFTYKPVIDTHTDLMSDYFEKYADDINGDGEVHVSVVNCSISNETSDMQYRNAQIQKLQALLAGDDEAMLFVTDDESIEYFEKLNFKNGIFEGEPVSLPKSFYEATASKDFGALPEGLTISCRKIEKTTLEGNENAKVTHKEALRIIEELKK